MHHSKSVSIELSLLSRPLPRWRQRAGNLDWPHDFLWWIDWCRCHQSIPSKKSGRARVPRKNLAPPAPRLKSSPTPALLAHEVVGLDRCLFVVGRLVLVHRIVSQWRNRPRKPPPSPRASHVLFCVYVPASGRGGAEGRGGRVAAAAGTPPPAAGPPPSPRPRRPAEPALAGGPPWVRTTLPTGRGGAERRGIHHIFFSIFHRIFLEKSFSPLFT